LIKSESYLTLSSGALGFTSGFWVLLEKREEEGFDALSIGEGGVETRGPCILNLRGWCLEKRGDSFNKTYVSGGEDGNFRFPSLTFGRWEGQVGPRKENKTRDRGQLETRRMLSKSGTSGRKEEKNHWKGERIKSSDLEIHFSHGKG